MHNLTALDFLNNPDLLSRDFRMTVYDVSSREYAEGYVLVSLSYVVTDSVTKDSFFFEEELSCLKNCPRSKDFFEFLRVAKVDYEDFFDIVGLVFDAKFVLDIHDGDFFLTIGDRRLVALPPKE